LDLPGKIFRGEKRKSRREYKKRKKGYSPANLIKSVLGVTRSKKGKKRRVQAEVGSKIFAKKKRKKEGGGRFQMGGKEAPHFPCCWQMLAPASRDRRGKEKTRATRGKRELEFGFHCLLPMKIQNKGEKKKGVEKGGGEKSAGPKETIQIKYRGGTRKKKEKERCRI